MNNYAIKIEGLKIVFGAHTALKNINIEIEKTSFVSIVGPNGGGKSTLLRALLGLIKPTEGKITIFGREPQDILPGELAYVPQIKTLDRSFPARAIELVLSGLHAKWVSFISRKDKEMAMEVLEKVGAAHLCGRPLSKLSGGELQRVYLARSIIRKPKLLLLDEPVTGIDMIGEKDISHLIEEYKKETEATIVMVTHDWESAYHHANKALMLNCEIVCFEAPELAFREERLRKTFGHVGHKHDMIFGVRHND